MTKQTIASLFAATDLAICAQSAQALLSLPMPKAETKAVTNAAPNFTRDVARELVDAPNDGEPPVDEPPVETDETEADPQSYEPTEQADEASAAKPEHDEGDPLAEGPADEEAAMDAHIVECQGRVDQLRLTIDRSKLELAEAERELGLAHDAKIKAFPPMSQGDAVKAFQKMELAKRAAARGDNPNARSALDASFAAARRPRRQGMMAKGTE